MEGLIVLGIIVIIIGLVVMGIHPYSRGGVRGGFRGSRGSASGPVWFVLIVIGIFLIALGVYLPG